MKNRMAVPPRPGTAIGMTPQRPQRTDATPVTPGAPIPNVSVDRNTDTFTYFTQVGKQPITGTGTGTPILYNGDRLWARVTLILETAGPVVVGTREDIFPVLSGKGSLLPVGREWERIIAKGTRLYVAATALNRISVTIEPLPWLEQIAQSAQKILTGGR